MDVADEKAEEGTQLEVRPFVRFWGKIGAGTSFRRHIDGNQRLIVNIGW